MVPFSPFSSARFARKKKGAITWAQVKHKNANIKYKYKSKMGPRKLKSVEARNLIDVETLNIGNIILLFRTSELGGALSPLN